MEEKNIYEAIKLFNDINRSGVYQSPERNNEKYAIINFINNLFDVYVVCDDETFEIDYVKFR